MSCTPNPRHDIIHPAASDRLSIVRDGESERGGFVMSPEERRIHRRAYSLLHKETSNASARRRYHANPEGTIARTQAYKATHREAIKANRAIHQEEARALSRAWRLVHPETIKATRKAYYANHREQILARNRAWRTAHPEIHTAQDWKRRAQKLRAVYLATAEHAKAIKAAYKGRCAYCGKKPQDLTIDHVIPLSKGGDHTPSNLAPACWSCNMSKGNREAPLLPARRLLL